MRERKGAGKSAVEVAASASSYLYDWYASCMMNSLECCSEWHATFGLIGVNFINTN